MATNARTGTENYSNEGRNNPAQLANGVPVQQEFTPPPKSDSAVKASNSTLSSLVSILNAAEAKLVSDGKVDVPNTYSIEFAPAILGNSKVSKGGKPNKAKTPMAAKTGQNQVDPEANKVDYDTRTFGFAAGTPIVTIIDEILKNSTYIVSQANAIVDEVTQEVKQQNNLGNLVWYKISTDSIAKDPFDVKRNGYAYSINYTINTYGVNSMDSEYFRQAVKRGVHKSYKYWFTGQNTAVIKFEQEFNHAYLTTLVNPQQLTSFRESTKNILAPREFQAAVAGSSTQGAEGKTNSPGASAADYLYSPTDIGETKLTIIGDPAWIQQGESSVGVSASNFDFNPFLPDGTINFDAQQIVFDIQWNPGVDYDLENTGLANPNADKDPQAIYTYIAKNVVSRFSKGMFEQTIEGSLFQDPISLKQSKTVTAAEEQRPQQVITTGTRTGIDQGRDEAAIARANFASTDERRINNNPLPTTAVGNTNNNPADTDTPVLNTTQIMNTET
jgi:hypothetical protein